MSRHPFWRFQTDGVGRLCVHISPRTSKLEMGYNEVRRVTTKLGAFLPLRLGSNLEWTIALGNYGGRGTGSQLSECQNDREDMT